MHRRRAIAVAAILVTALAGVLAALVIWHGEQQRFDDRRDGLGTQAAQAVRNAVAGSADAFRGAAGQVTAGGRLRPESFNASAPDFLALGVLSGVAYEPLVSQSRRAAVQTQLGRPFSELAPAGGLRRAPRRARYAPVTLVWPQDAARRAVIGFDVLSEPGRADAAGRAAVSGTPQLSAPLRLARSRRPGLSIYYALYRGGRIPSSAAARRSTVIGWYTGSIQSAQIEQKFRRQLPRGTRLRVVDRAAGADRLVFGSERPLGDSSARAVPIAGRTWVVSVKPAERADPSTALVVGFAGILLALLVGITLLQSARRERAEGEARALAERERGRRAVLLRAAESMERATGSHERLRSLAAALVPDLGDIAQVAELGNGPEFRHVATVARDAALEREAGERVIRADDAQIAEALRSGRPQPMATADRSAIVVPLAARGHSLGVLAITRVGDRPAPFDAGDMALTAELGAHAALALDNARLYELEHDIAQTLQRALLPPKLPDMSPLEAAARFRPAGERIEVGGDLYDVFRMPGSWMAVVADVCGKGPRAAALTAAARYTLRAAGDVSPAALLSTLDRELRLHSDGERFVTVALARLTVDPGGRSATALISVGGHPPPLVVRADGSVEEPEVAGPIVGVLGETVFNEIEVALGPGDALLLYTDGATEARRDGELFGDERLRSAAATAGGARADRLVAAVEDAVLEWVRDAPQDDIALLAIALPRD